MADPAFVELVERLIESMGQRLEAARPMPEGLVIRSEDGFVFAFFEDPATVSLESVRRIFHEAGSPSSRLVLLSRGRLPLAIGTEAIQRGATLVEGRQFTELVRQLGLETYLGEEPRPPAPGKTRLLPSAQELEQVVGRARAWQDWGVPALALRFYRQAAELKPEYLPARSGMGRALLALGLSADADRLFDQVLALRPDDVEARLGKAGVLGASGRTLEEVAIYRTLLIEHPGRTDVRAQLVAALVALSDWRGARAEIETMFTSNPEDPQLRYLHAVALEKTGDTTGAERERRSARHLGLTHERETVLATQLGVPPPEPPVRRVSVPAVSSGTGAATESRREPSSPELRPAKPAARRTSRPKSARKRK